MAKTKAKSRARKTTRGAKAERSPKKAAKKKAARKKRGARRKAKADADAGEAEQVESAKPAPRVQYVVGYVGVTSRLFTRIDRIIFDREDIDSWGVVAGRLGMSRQALISSIKRDCVKLPRLQELCAVLDLDVRDFIDDPLTLEQNLEWK